MAVKTNKNLAEINSLFELGELKCEIDGPHPFEKIPWAIQRFGDGLHHGKIVIKVS